MGRWEGDMRLALVLLGGAFGSGARYLVATAMADRFGAAFPWGTLSVNIAGSFLIGLIATLADEQGRIGADTRLLLITGVLGGFTTFSAFSLETLRLAQQQQLGRAVLYVGASLAVSFAAVTLGLLVGRAFGR